MEVQNMLSARACERCNGNMMLEEYLGESEFVCLQCGHRRDAPELRKPAYAAGHTKKAA
jgi:hypothetical protein